METIKIQTRADLKTKAGKPFLKINDNYSCWDSDLFGMFQVGNVLDCETTTSKDGNWLNITGARKSEGKVETPQGTYSADSRTDSIENQVAVKTIAELWQAGKFNDDHPLVEGLQQWLLKRIAPAGHISMVEPDINVKDMTGITQSQLDTMRKMAQADDKNVKWTIQIKKHYPEIMQKAEKAGAKSVGEYLNLLDSHQAEVLILEQTAREETE